MEITEVFRIIEKQLDSTNKELEFKKDKATDESISFSGEKGIYRIVYDSSSSIMAFECAYENSENAEFNTISRSLFDAESYDERDAKSLANEINDEITSVSRTKAKNGVVSYDTDSLANRFATLYPDMKDDIRANIAQYGEFLPETFFMEKGSARIIDVIANGSETDVKKLFKMLNEVYEDGTNEVQDIIGVTILGEMKNDPKLMEVADKYMSDYMSGPVHEINKITAKNNSLTKKLKNPPPYKPKKKRKGFMQNALQSQDLNNR